MQTTTATNEVSFEWRVRQLINVIEYRDRTGKQWVFHIGHTSGGDLYLQVQFDGIDAYTGQPAGQHGRKWYLSPHMTKSEIVMTALKAVLTAEEHEARENFKYLGKRVFGPDFDVDALAEICDKSHMDIRN